MNLDNELHLQVYLIHVSTLPENQQDLYYDIIESLNFAISINAKHKIDFEFQNLCDFLDDTEFEDTQKVFEFWSKILEEMGI